MRVREKPKQAPERNEGGKAVRRIGVPTETYRSREPAEQTTPTTHPKDEYWSLKQNRVVLQVKRKS